MYYTDVLELTKDEATFERVYKIINCLYDRIIIVEYNQNLGKFICINNNNYLCLDSLKFDNDVFEIALAIAETVANIDDDDEYDYWCDILDF